VGRSALGRTHGRLRFYQLAEQSASNSHRLGPVGNTGCMRVGVVSDVHNNVEALTYALAALRHCELVLSLGDLISDYHVSPEIISLANAANLVGILGNHEKTILQHAGSQMRFRLAPSDLAYLEALPAGRDLDIDGRRVKVAHGSPWDDPNDYHCVYVRAHDATALARLEVVDADVILLGHTHVAMALRMGDKLVLNPGSCGEARDAGRRLTFAELDFSAGIASIYQIHAGRLAEQVCRAEF
jgi:putative phosphoesterase